MAAGPARVIRTLAAGEVAELVGWAAGEGWNPGLADATAFRAADPEGFLGAFVAGEMVAGIAAVAYDAAFGFIGLYICRPDRRGHGHGKAVWDAGMAHLGARTIGLDGVQAQQANYRSMGFEAAYRTLRYSGRPSLPGAAADIRPVTPELMTAVEAYDRACFPAARPAFLARWLAAPRIARVLLRDGALAGYGVLRACGEGAKIGPLFADDREAALALLGALAAAAPGSGIHLDVPALDPEFLAILAASGLEPGFETSRMYRGAAPVLRSERIFGVTTLELG